MQCWSWSHQKPDLGVHQSLGSFWTRFELDLAHRWLLGLVQFLDVWNLLDEEKHLQLTGLRTKSSITPETVCQVRDVPDTSLSSPVSADQPTNHNLLWSQTCWTRTQQNPLNLQTGAVAAAQRLLGPSPFPVCQTRWDGHVDFVLITEIRPIDLCYVFISSVNCRVQLAALPVFRDVAWKTGSADR